MTIKTEAQEESRAITIGAILSSIGSIIAICPLSFDFVLGAYSQGQELGKNIVNVVTIRLIFILLTIIFSIVFLIRNRSSKVLAGALLVSIIISIVLPFAFSNAQSIGGLFATVFLAIALIGGIVIGVNSFRK